MATAGSRVRSSLEAWRARSRGGRIADVALGATVALLAIALVVNGIADVRQSRRMQVDQKVITRYLIDFAGGTAAFGRQPYIKVHKRVDLVCAFLRHGHGGLCLQVLSKTPKSRTILREYPCVYSPPWPKHVKRWKPPPPPPGERYCPAHPRKVT